MYDYLKLFAVFMALLGLVPGAAEANPSAPPPLSPSEIQALVKPAPGVPGARTGGGKLKTAPAAAAIVTGWNNEVGSASQWWTPDNINFIVFCYNADGTFFFFLINTPVLMSGQNELHEACEHPGGYKVHVTDPSTGAFDSIYIIQP